MYSLSTEIFQKNSTSLKTAPEILHLPWLSQEMKKLLVSKTLNYGKYFIGGKKSNLLLKRFLDHGWHSCLDRSHKYPQLVVPPRRPAGGQHWRSSNHVQFEHSGKQNWFPIFLWSESHHGVSRGFKAKMTIQKRPACSLNRWVEFSLLESTPEQVVHNQIIWE